VIAVLKPVYLISGSDRPKIARAIQRLRARVGDDAVETLNANETSGADAVAACNALGLFGGGERLVLVDGVDGRRQSDGRLTGGWKAADVKAIAEYLGSPAPDTVLALVAEEVKATSPLGKACAKVGEVLVYDVRKRAVPAWVRAQFALHEAHADDDACRALVEIVGESPDALAAEVAKLATWANGEPITSRDVEALAAGFAETSIFSLTDAWGRRDVAAVLGASEAILERASSPRSSEIPRMVARVSNHVSRVRDCQAMAAEGIRPREAATRLKRSPYYVDRLFAQAANFGVDELRGAVVRLAELDLAVKGNSRLSPDLELQRALVDITRPAEAPGAR
jgi:DNA polymerase III delta subunit